MSKRFALSACAIVMAGSVVAVVPSTSADAASIYRNCTALHTKWRHGVGKQYAHDHVTSGRPVTNFYRSTRQYNIAMSHNRGLDRDKDGVACEAH